MSSADILDYLVEQQKAERISAATMARKLEISESQWCHLRKGRGNRKLTGRQIERAIQLYPELADRIAQQVPA